MICVHARTAEAHQTFPTPNFFGAACSLLTCRYKTTERKISCRLGSRCDASTSLTHPLTKRMIKNFRENYPIRCLRFVKSMSLSREAVNRSSSCQPPASLFGTFILVVGLPPSLYSRSRSLLSASSLVRPMARLQGFQNPVALLRRTKPGDYFFGAFPALALH